MSRYGLLPSVSALACLIAVAPAAATFSIVAVDPNTQEVGSAGASCIWGASVISDVHPGVGAINTQAWWLVPNQNYARTLMDQGFAPEAIIDSLVANDAQGNPTIRQYLIVDLVGGGRSAGHTGINCDDYKSHDLGVTYAVAGNILIGQEILDDMAQAFTATAGTLADRLMASLQAANVPGADTRCLPDRPARSAYIHVARPTDPASDLTLNLDVWDTNAGENPIDMLQDLYDEWRFEIQVTDLGPTVVSGPGSPAEFDVEVAYLGAIDSDVTIALDQSALPAGWSAELEWGVTVDPDSITLTSMTESQAETLVVRTFPTPLPGVGEVTASIWSVGNPAVVVARDYHTFSSTPAILFVDDDRGDAFETIFENATLGAGYFSTTWDFANLGRPSTEYLGSFDAVIWSTGAPQTQTLGANNQQSLMDYLDGGGRLFLSSHGYLNHQGVTPFTSGYLGVTAFVPDVGAVTATGRPSDPIGDGLSFSLTPPFPDSADVVTESASASVWLDGPSGAIAVRNDPGAFRSVFMSAAYEGVPAGSRALVMDRILDWLFEGVTDAPSLTTPTPASISLARAAPNPFAGSTRIRFTVPTTELVRLSIHDVAGRLVRVLVDQEFHAGEYTSVWNGRDDAGLRVGGGTYFVKLDAGGVSRARKVAFIGGRGP